MWNFFIFLAVCFGILPSLAFVASEPLTVDQMDFYIGATVVTFINVHAAHNPYILLFVPILLSFAYANSLRVRNVFKLDYPFALSQLVVKSSELLAHLIKSGTQQTIADLRSQLAINTKELKAAKTNLAAVHGINKALKTRIEQLNTQVSDKVSYQQESRPSTQWFSVGGGLISIGALQEKLDDLVNTVSQREATIAQLKRAEEQKMAFWKNQCQLVGEGAAENRKLIEVLRPELEALRASYDKLARDHYTAQQGADKFDHLVELIHQFAEPGVNQDLQAATVWFINGLRARGVDVEHLKVDLDRLDVWTRFVRDGHQSLIIPQQGLRLDPERSPMRGLKLIGTTMVDPRNCGHEARQIFDAATRHMPVAPNGPLGQYGYQPEPTSQAVQPYNGPMGQFAYQPEPTGQVVQHQQVTAVANETPVFASAGLPATFEPAAEVPSLASRMTFGPAETVASFAPAPAPTLEKPSLASRMTFGPAETAAAPPPAPAPAPAPTPTPIPASVPASVPAAAPAPVNEPLVAATAAVAKKRSDPDDAFANVEAEVRSKRSGAGRSAAPSSNKTGTRNTANRDKERRRRLGGVLESTLLSKGS
ncbi:hypothetical protein BU24DRAFT_465583 [Aaosphaeria arxii CBS 175.79]|uniref:Uncharacterized protein n=1 Tax=Aaosphaeria arxii CBS 175.79 TaxID=1450172 RepID=A0A6A5XGT7_9PLEO|nr:uncharacterized protein BU24DRAFT_465583 [Aaosphaeria arxii CBS 175.79]KAF2012011.1 hypothetical protein BU24DRAFT_465583 [Aaosphaeria arxii CBS 175.79]